MRPPAINGCAYTAPSTSRAKRRWSLGLAGAPGATPAREAAPPYVDQAGVAAVELALVRRAGAVVRDGALPLRPTGESPPQPASVSRTRAAGIAARRTCPM